MQSDCIPNEKVKATLNSIIEGMSIRAACKEFQVARSHIVKKLGDIEIQNLKSRVSKLEEQLTAKKKPATLLLYDIHFPHECQENIDIAIEYARTKYNIERIILGEDVMDCESISRFARGENTMPLKEEIEYTKTKFHELRKIFPQAIIYYLKGNHEARLQNYLWNKASEIASLKGLTIQEQLELDSYRIKWIDNDKLKIETGRYFRIGKLNILHGHELGICPSVNPAHRFLERSKGSIVVGHVHTADEKFVNTVDNSIIGCHCIGTLAYMFPEYRPQNNWVAGFAVVTFDADGYYSIDNRKIIHGRIV